MPGSRLARVAARRSWLAWLAWPVVVLGFGGACGDTPGHRAKLGESCIDTDQCATGICGSGICLDPTQDDDGDGLLNQTEVDLESNPRNRDSDYDGAPDRVELSETLGAIDTDGDGLADILESATADADHDCIPDQYDPHNDVPDTDLSPLVAVICRGAGVCSGDAHARLAVTCAGGSETATCDYSRIEHFEAEEVTCDGLDNDCDGVTDDGFPDADGDHIADCVDPDSDNDAIANADDNCPVVANPLQEDSDGDGAGDACDAPEPPLVGAIDPSSTSSDTTPALIGVSDPNATVIVYAERGCATELARGAADANGVFAVEVPVSDQLEHRYYLRAENRAALQSACFPSGLTYTLDTVAPAAPVLARWDAADAYTPSAHVSGTAEPRATVTLRSGADTFEATANPAGDFGVIVTVPGPGSWDFTAFTTDAAGNHSDEVAFHTFVVLTSPDMQPPPAPVPYPEAFVPASPNHTSQDPSVRWCQAADITCAARTYAPFEGTAVAGELTEEAGCPEGMRAARATLHVDANIATPILVTCVGANHVSSESVALGAYLYDDVAPAAPTLDGSLPAEAVASRALRLPIRGEPETTVFVTTDALCAHDALAAASIGRSGAATLAFDAPAEPATALYAYAVDAAGNTSPCVLLFTFHYDGSVPEPPSAHDAPFAPASPSGATTTPRVQVCVQPGVTTEVFTGRSCEGTALALPAAVADPSCVTQLAAATNLPVGANTTTRVFGQSVTANGRRSACVYLGEFRHDDVPPSLPSTATFDPQSPAAETRVRVEFYASAGDSAAVYSDASCAGPLRATAIADGDDKVSVVIDVARDATTTLWTRISDAAGNHTDCLAIGSYRNDSSVPAAPIALASPFVPSSPSNATTTPRLTFCADPSLRVEVFAGAGCAGDATVFPTFVVDPRCPSGQAAAGDASVTPNTTEHFFAREISATGVPSGCTLVGTFTHDDVPPAAPALVQLRPASPSADPNVRLDLTLDPDSRATIYASPICDPAGTLGHASASAPTAAFEVPHDTSTMLYAKAFDAAGNASDCVVLASFIHDDSVPPAPFRHPVPLTPASPSRTDTRPLVAACAGSTDDILLYAGAGCTGDPVRVTPAVDDACAASLGVSHPMDVPPNATTRFFGRAISPTGVTSPCVFLAEYVHDALAPPAPVPGLAPPSPTPDTTVAATGIGEAGARIDLARTASCAAPIASGFIDAGNHWLVPVPLVHDSDNAIYGRVTDLAGNQSACVHLFNVRQDGQAPGPAHVLAMSLSPSSNATPSFIGCAEAGTEVRLYLRSTCDGSPAASAVAATTNGTCLAGEQRFDVAVPVALNQTSTLYARVVDAAGNRGDCATFAEYRHDDIAPTAPTAFDTRFRADGGNTVSFTQYGTVEPYGQLRVKLAAAANPTSCAAATLLTAGVAGADGRQQLIIDLDRAQDASIFLESVDAAGNVGACAGPIPVIGPLSVRTTDRMGNVMPHQRVVLQDPFGNVRAGPVTMASDFAGGDIAFPLVYDSCMVTVGWSQDQNYRGTPLRAYQLETVYIAKAGDALVLQRPYLRSSDPVVGVSIDLVATPVVGESQSQQFEVFAPGCDTSTGFDASYPTGRLTIAQDDLDRCATVVDGTASVPVVAVAKVSGASGLLAYVRTTASWDAAQSEPLVSLSFGDASAPWRSDFDIKHVPLRDSAPSVFGTFLGVEALLSSNFGHDNLRYNSFASSKNDGSFPPVQIPSGVTVSVDEQFIPGLHDSYRTIAGKAFEVPNFALSQTMVIHQAMGDMPATSPTIELGGLLPIISVDDTPDMSDPDRWKVTGRTTGTGSIEDTDFGLGVFFWEHANDPSERLEWRVLLRPRSPIVIDLPAVPPDMCPEDDANCVGAKFRPSTYDKNVGPTFNWWDFEPLPGVSAEAGGNMAGFADAWRYFGSSLFDIYVFMNDNGVDWLLPHEMDGRITTLTGLDLYQLHARVDREDRRREPVKNVSRPRSKRGLDNLTG